MVDKPKWYTPDEARTNYFEEGKVSRHNIYDALRTGKLSHIKLGRRILIREQDLSEWVKSLIKPAI